LSSFIRNIFRKLTGAGLRPAPQVYVAAFGKHPGWNDHIDDPGLESQRLVALKRVLYVQGVAGNIDSGAWERLGEQNQVPGFHHLVLCQCEQDSIVARLWSSSDGKGRTRYPMIVAIQGSDLPLERVVDLALPALEECEAACTATRDAAAVRALIDETRRRLRGELLGGAAEAPPKDEPSSLGWLAARPEMGQDQRGLLLVLYQVEREMAAFRPGAQADRMIASGSRHMRVPACADSPQQVLKVWARFLAEELDPAAPRMIILPLGHGWVDLIVGEPTVSQLFCMRATPRSIPLTTDIPYTLEESFVARMRKRIGTATTQATAAETGPAAAEVHSQA